MAFEADPYQYPAAGPERSRRLFVYNGGFLTQRRLRRILHLAGHELRIGLPGPDDAVAVWGNSPTAHRGLAVAAKRSLWVPKVSVRVPKL